MPRRNGGANDIGANSAIAIRKGFHQPGQLRWINLEWGDDPLDKAQLPAKIGLMLALDDDRIHQAPIKPNAHLHPGLGAIGFGLIYQVIKAPIEVGNP